MMTSKEEAQAYQDTLEQGMALLCEAMGVESDVKYDGDEADIHHYLACFRDAADAIKAVSAGQELKEQPLSVAVKQGVLSISVGVDILCFASETGRSYGLESVKVTDKELFLKEMVRQLEREKEDGTTPVHEMFDNAVSQMLEDGEEGVDLVEESSGDE